MSSTNNSANQIKSASTLNQNTLISGVILAGGQGSRMQGLDKGLQVYRGQTLVRHAIERLSAQTNELLISANRNFETYQALGFAVVADSDKDYQGPMAGVAAGLDFLNRRSEHTENDNNKAAYALISSCDTPLLPSFLTARLLAALENSPASVAVVHDGERSQNLHCLIKASVWDNLINSYQNGERAMYRWQHEVGREEVDFSDCAGAFKNFNTLESLNSKV